MKKILGLVALATSVSAFASTPMECRFASYRPGAVHKFVVAKLPELGIAAVPYALSGAPVKENGTYTMLRDGRYIGTLRFSQDVALGKYELSVLDALQRVVLQVNETNTAVPPGLVRELNMYTLLQPPKDGRMPFTTVLPQLSVIPRNLRYGLEVGHHTFGVDFRDQLNWLLTYLRTTHEAKGLEPKTPQERIFWSLAADPIVAPYVGRVRVVFGRDRVWLYGTVPSNLVYGRVIDRVRDAGFRYVIPELRIDTGSYVKLPLPEACDL